MRRVDRGGGRVVRCRMGTQTATEIQLLHAIRAIVLAAVPMTNSPPVPGFPDPRLVKLTDASRAASDLLTPQQSGVAAFDRLEELVDTADRAIQQRRNGLDHKATDDALRDVVDKAKDFLGENRAKLSEADTVPLRPIAGKPKPQ